MGALESTPSSSSWSTWIFSPFLFVILAKCFLSSTPFFPSAPTWTVRSRILNHMLMHVYCKLELTCNAINSSHVLHLAILALASSVIKFKAWKSRRIEQYPEYRKVPLELKIITRIIKIKGYLKRVSHCGILYGSRYFVESRFGNPSNENPFQVENFFLFFQPSHFQIFLNPKFWYRINRRKKTVPLLHYHAHQIDMVYK